MKVRALTWMTVGAYAFCGVMFSIIVMRFKEIFSQMELTLPLATRAVLFPTPLGWLIILFLIAVFVLRRGAKIQSEWFEVALLLMLVLVTIFVVCGLLAPLVSVSSHKSLVHTEDAPSKVAWAVGGSPSCVNSLQLPRMRADSL